MALFEHTAASVFETNSNAYNSLIQEVGDIVVRKATSLSYTTYVLAHSYLKKCKVQFVMFVRSCMHPCREALTWILCIRSMLRHLTCSSPLFELRSRHSSHLPLKKPESVFRMSMILQFVARPIFAIVLTDTIPLSLLHKATGELSLWNSATCKRSVRGRCKDVMTHQAVLDCIVTRTYHYRDRVCS